MTTSKKVSKRAAELIAEHQSTDGYAAAASGIVMLPVEKLHGHPDNPRREISDVAELAENIKKHGIRQNLTVVQDGDGYKIIIGHRRHAAATLAGLKEVPCIVAEMSDREQLETMLAENLMREDLKLSEQVRSFEQLRLEGATADEIAETTGFSRTYVSTRLRYASELGADKLKEIETRAEKNEHQVTLDEIDKICSVRSTEDRRKLSESIGTNNFGWNYRDMIELQKAKDKVKEAKKILAGLGASEISFQDANCKYSTSTRAYTDIKTFIGNPEKTLSTRLPEGNTEPLFYAFNGDCPSWFYICIGAPGEIDKKLRSAEDREREKREEEARVAREKQKQLDELFEKAYKSRREFVDDLTASDIKDPSLVASFCVFCSLFASDADPEELAEMFDLPEQGDETDERYFEKLQDKAAARSKNSQAALVTCVKTAYVSFCDHSGGASYDRIYRESSLEWLMNLYGYLVRFGYQMSDEENALVYGSHELYRGNEA